jgi:outer membrane protein assembly factor BamE (lipoprotein component of BamABCDE complex)
VLLPALLAFGTACIDESTRVTAGKEFPIERMVAIQKGISTRTTVRELMGPPLKTIRIDDRQEKWRYYVRREQTHAILWVLTGSTDVWEIELEITFDGNFVEIIDPTKLIYQE